MEKWRVGVLPADGGLDKRGWSLRGQLLYPVLAEDGKVLAWVARLGAVGIGASGEIRPDPR